MEKWFEEQIAFASKLIEKVNNKDARNKLHFALISISGQRGALGMGLLTALIGVVVVIIVLANAIPILWPMAVDASANITSMNGTDAGTQMIQGFWPVVLLLVGLGVAIGLIIYALKAFGVLG